MRRWSRAARSRWWPRSARGQSVGRWWCAGRVRRTGRARPARAGRPPGRRRRAAVPAARLQRPRCAASRSVSSCSVVRSEIQPASRSCTAANCSNGRTIAASASDSGPRPSGTAIAPWVVVVAADGACGAGRAAPPLAVPFTGPPLTGGVTAGDGEFSSGRCAFARASVSATPRMSGSIPATFGRRAAVMSGGFRSESAYEANCPDFFAFFRSGQVRPKPRVTCAFPSIASQTPMSCCAAINTYLVHAWKRTCPGLRRSWHGCLPRWPHRTRTAVG